MRFILHAGIVAFVAWVIAAPSARAGEAQTTHDVVVYGATPGGVTAAVAAGREGKSVMLVEPLPLVGGILSGGMGLSDATFMHRETLGGLFRSFRQRIEKDYIQRGVELPYEVNNDNGAAWTSEPHVNERVFEAMLREAGVQVVLKERLNGVERNGAVITALRTHSGRRFPGKVFIDASYEGDLLAAASVTYRVGREGREEYGESFAGVRYPEKLAFDMANPVNQVSARDDNGEPLPLITGTERPPEGQGDHLIQTYNFRLCLTDNPANRVPFAKPAGYDPARYELFRRLYKAFPDYGLPDRIPTWVSNDSLPFSLFPIPGGKFDVNGHHSGLLSLDLVGGSWAYPEADYQRRQAIWNDHRSYTEGLFHFLKTDPAVPQRVRGRMQELGYCKDEFAEYGHFPPVLYVREGRRLVGEHILTQADVLDQRAKPDPIALVSFPIESRTVQRILTKEGGFINEGMLWGPTVESGFRWKTTKGDPIPVSLGKPYQIPYRSILPKPEECTNLLVPVALSASHIAFSSVRVEPTWMILGESAGIAAAIAVEDESPLQKIDISKLMRRLEERGQILRLSNDGH